MDALIALHMRKNGFSKEAIVEAIQHCSPQAQPERAVCDWQRYAERAASFAFGIDGDMRLSRSAAYREERQRENAQDPCRNRTHVASRKNNSSPCLA